MQDSTHNELWRTHRMFIAHFSDVPIQRSNHWGGIETVILETSRSAIKEGHSVCIYCNCDVEEHCLEGIEVKNISAFSQDLENPFLKKSLKVAHLHLVKRKSALNLCSKLRKKGVAYLIHMHGGGIHLSGTPMNAERPIEYYKRNALFRASEWLLYQNVFSKASKIVCMNEPGALYLKQRYPKLSDSQIALIANGVDVEHFSHGDGEKFRREYGFSSEDQIILHVARFDQCKNQLMLIKIFNQVSKIIEAARLVFVGGVSDKLYFQALKQMAKDFQIEDRVLFICGLDYHSDALVNAFHASDILALPSTFESFGMVILEAWAAKKPVLVSSLLSLKNLVEDQKSGFVCDLDRPEQWLNQCVHLLKDKKTAQALGENGFEEVQKKYSWRYISEKMLDLYKKIA